MEQPVLTGVALQLVCYVWLVFLAEWRVAFRLPVGRVVPRAERPEQGPVCRRFMLILAGGGKFVSSYHLRLS